MSKIKAVTRPKKNIRGEVPIFVRISDADRTRYMTTGLKIRPSFWNKRLGCVRKNDYYDYDAMNKIIETQIREARGEEYKLRADGKYASVDIIKKRTQSHDLNEDFIAYAKVFTQRKRHQNLRTGDRYKTIVKKLEKYSGGRLRFKSITVSWLQEYAEWMALRKGNSQNTIHSNLRCIRAILYEAIREGRFPQANNPFFVMKLKQPKVERVKLNEKEIMSLIKLKVEEGSVEEIAKDTFLFSIFACGMRYSDVALLKWGNIEGEHIRYRMQKTGQQQTVAVVPQAKKILDRYADGRKKSRK
ncbi:MAG TPA: site-specific integrase, partial [Balneolales bacterium]|nr:site-specific integrase [Balneolales bacterium]